MELETVWRVGRYADRETGLMEHLVRAGGDYAWSTRDAHRFADRADAEAALAAVGAPEGAQAYPSRVGRIRL